MLNTSTDFKLGIYGGIRQFKGRATVSILGSTHVLEDDKIFSMNILEEMSTINESLPANEITLTVSNEDGVFDLLNFENMYEIIASKPTITSELGLVTFDLEEQEYILGTFDGKVTGSTVANPNKYFYRYATSLGVPSLFTAETTQAHYDRLNATDNVTSAISATGLNAPYGLWQFDIVEILTRKYGESIWAGKTSLADRILLAEQYVKYLTANWVGYGTGPTGNNATLRLGSGSSYFGTTRTHASGTPTLLQISTSSVASAIDQFGKVNVVAHGLPSDGVTTSTIRTDRVWIDIRIDPFQAVEWMPTGMFFLSEWKNERTQKIITMVGHDYFNQFNDISYEPKGITNLRDLAIDVLTVGGVPTNKQIIDSSLNNVTVRGFPERLNCREALQHIGIAGVAAVGQDRSGNVFIKPFRAIDESTNYLVYTISQPSLYGYVTPTTYLINDSGGGMKYLDFEQMYNEPSISLQPSIYQVVVKVFIGDDPIEQLYTNARLNGKSGESFTIDNPLINTIEMADKVAEWFIREINYNAIYTINWRQNPALECADMILVEDSFDAEKQTRIIKQEFNYKGYLEGVTESRGGV